jgi:hypothetical protein
MGVQSSSSEEGSGGGGRGKFASTLFPKMLILGLDNRKDAAKITMESFPKRHLVTSDFKMAFAEVHILDLYQARKLQNYPNPPRSPPLLHLCHR